jgi:hypothetical protein
MSLPQKYYLEHMCKSTGYRASWLPDRPLKIGDIGKLEDGLFILYSTLEQQQINCVVRESPSELGLDYSDKGSFSIQAKGATGNLLDVTGAAVDGTLMINFAENKGLIFQMTGAKLKVIENLAEVEKSVLAKYKSSDWPKEWVFIAELVVTDNATIIISTSSDNKIELGCSAKVGFTANKLADPQLGLTVVSEQGSSCKILGAKGLTPFYRIRGVYEPFWSKPQFRTRYDPTIDQQKIKIKQLEFNSNELVV